MKPKKQINHEIHQILKESGVPPEYWDKILMKLVNYTFKKLNETKDNEHSDYLVCKMNGRYNEKINECS